MVAMQKIHLQLQNMKTGLPPSSGAESLMRLQSVGKPLSSPASDWVPQLLTCGPYVPDYPHSMATSFP